MTHTTQAVCSKAERTTCCPRESRLGEKTQATGLATGGLFSLSTRVFLAPRATQPCAASTTCGSST